MKSKKYIISILAVIFVIGSCVADANLRDVKTFTEKSYIDGVDVSGMNLKEATSALEAGLNKMSLNADAEGALVEVSTPFKYGNAVGIHSKLVISHIDIRNLFGAKKDYKLGLNVISGIDELSANLEDAYPCTDVEVQTANAYIDYNAMSIIPEVQGDNLDYAKLANAIAEQRKEDPTNGTFTFSRKDYALEPSVKSEDLEEELAWAKEHLAQGFDVVDGNGETVHMGADQMAKIAVYNSGNVKYDEDSAMALAETLAGNDRPDKVKIETHSGVKELYNYALTARVDKEKSAESIISAVKASIENTEPVTATIYTDEDHVFKLDTWVEISISAQHLWYYKDGNLVIDSPIVTGMYGSHDTPHGVYKLAYKQSPATLKGRNDDDTEYESHVVYWMPFNGAIGLHDAPWRSSFGGKIYMGNGSHGCVNLPHNTARTLFNNLSSGSIVVVY